MGTDAAHGKGFRQADSVPDYLLPSPLSLRLTTGMCTALFGTTLNTCSRCRGHHGTNERCSSTMPWPEARLVSGDSKDARHCQSSSITTSLPQKGQFEEFTGKPILLQGRRLNSPAPKIDSLPLLTHGRLDALPPTESSSNLQNLPGEPRTVLLQFMN